MPRDFPDFPHHSQMASYLEAYVDRFGLRPTIVFDAEVSGARRLADDRWRVSLSNGENRFYDALVVANGHHWDPRWPNPPYPGQFAGEVVHAHAYRDPTAPVDMRRKRVLIVGLGNSAMDIACELARSESASTVLLSGHRGVWVLPKRVFGRPIDQLPGTNLPWRLQSLTLAGVIRATLGVPWHHGLPRPDHRPLAAHPTLSQDLYGHIDRGAIITKPGITRLGERTVTFEDRTVEDVDVIVYCTGYKVSFPFFDPGFLAAPGNDLPLWRRLVRPGDANLFFVGLFQAIGALMPIVEAQARLIGDYLVGACALPSVSRMTAELERDRERLSRRFVRSERHTMEVDFDRYLRDLARERRRGRVRAHPVDNTLQG
jgi:dimethylaniline monooxygenase (N-oxide forming)